MREAVSRYGSTVAVFAIFAYLVASSIADHNYDPLYMDGILKGFLLGATVLANLVNVSAWLRRKLSPTPKDNA